MTWDHAATKTSLDLKDPNLLHVAMRNGSNRPVVFGIEEVSTSNAGRDFEHVTVSMVTRRSTVNPGEVVKFKLAFTSPVTRFPKSGKVDFKLMVKRDSFFLDYEDFQAATLT
jgi:hypothetical protein